MDGRIAYELGRIQAHLPQKLIDNLMMDDPNDVNFDAMNAELLKSKNLDDSAKKAIAYSARTLNKKKEKIVNPAVARQIEEYFDREVKRAIEDGRLPKASALEADRFFMERVRKIQGHGK